MDWAKFIQDNAQTLITLGGTIFGAILGFIAAFFAEPVKLCFQNKSRKKNFRLALYSEIYNNWNFLSTFLVRYKWNDPHQLKAYSEGAIKHSIRMDCYTYFVSQYPELYFQLKESTHINMLYAYLTAANPVLYSENDVSKFHENLKSFVQLVEEHVARNHLDKKLMEKASSKKDADFMVEEFNKQYQSAE